MTTNGDETNATVSDVTATMERVRDVLANWPYPPDGGWTADDLDLLPQDGPHGEPDFFKRVELVDGALIFMSPQRRFHDLVIRRLADVLDRQSPDDLTTATQMDLRLGPRQRPCPDAVVINASAAADLSRTAYVSSEVRLVIEVVSPESEHRDRHVKPKIYANAGVEHFWLVEEERGKPVIHTFQLDPSAGEYGSTGAYRGQLKIEEPFPVNIDLADLLQ